MSLFNKIFDLYYTKVVKRKVDKESIDIQDLLSVVSKIGNNQVVVNLDDKIKEIITPELIEECVQEIDLREKVKNVIKHSLSHEIENNFVDEVDSAINDIDYKWDINIIITRSITEVLKDVVSKIKI